MIARANCVADDWGMSRGVNAGILKLCELGVVQCVSMFGNLTGVEHGLDALLRIERLRFSLHLNFTYGRPLSPPGEVSSLCRPNGFFPDFPAFLGRAVRGRLSPADLRLETRRQIRRLRELGVPLTGVEGHHHVHLIPSVFAGIAPVLAEEGIEWLRLPADSGHLPSFALGLAFRGWSRVRAAKSPRLVRTLYLRGRDYGSARRLEKKLRNRRGLPAIAHPAEYVDDARNAEDFADPYQTERVGEFRALMDWSRMPR